MEHWDELWPGGFRFRFDDNVFKPSTDTFLLGDFAEVRRGECVCDLGAGIGLLGLLLLARQQELHITNIDIDSAACALAEENAAVNGLEDRVAVLRADLRDRTALPKAGSFDLCVANPAPLTSCVLRQRICSAAADGSAWSTGRNGRRS